MKKLLTTLLFGSFFSAFVLKDNRFLPFHQIRK